MNSPAAPDPVLASHAPGVDAQNPWPGLAPFTEDQQAYFHGRSRDSAELLRMVKREALTVVYGRSGLGKSSLLQAGLFPLLRKEEGLPVYIRLDHSSNAPSLAQQALTALSRAAAAAEVEFVPPTGSQSLWEYFQHIETEFWTARNRPATVVLVFDQFEEIFTLARADEAARKRAQEFITELSDLVENRVPESMKLRFDNDEIEVDQYEFDQSRCKVVLSLREDYVPELQSLRTSMRSIMIVSNWKRVLPMSGQEAMEAVRQPGSTIVDAEVARRIVEFVAAGSRSGDHGLTEKPATGPETADPMAELVIEPALLSVVCFELNRKRQTRNLPQITEAILSESSTEILREFYERSVADVPSAVRAFVEDRLLTAAGHRNSEHLDEALRIEGMTTAVLEKLIGRRLIRLDTRLGATRIELTHDRLADPVRSSREQRQGKLRAEAALRETSRRRRRLVGQAFTVLSALCVVLFFVALWKQGEASRQRDTAVSAMRVAEDKQQKIQKLLARNFLEDIQGTIDKGYGAAYLLKLQELAGTGWLPPYQESIAPFIASNAFAADALIPLPDDTPLIAFTARGDHVATLGSSGAVAIYSQAGSNNQWTPQNLPGEASTRFSCIATHPGLANGLALRTEDGRVLIWDCSRNAPAHEPIKLPEAPALAAGVRLPIAFSFDGKTLYAALGNGAICAINVSIPSNATEPAYGTVIGSNQRKFARGGEYSSDDGVIPVGVPRQLLVMDGDARIIATTESSLWLWSAKELDSPTLIAPGSSIAATPDRHTVVIVRDTTRREASMVDMEDRIVPLVQVNSSGGAQLSTSADGKRLILGGRTSVRVFELPQSRTSSVLDDEQMVWEQKLEHSSSTAVAFRPDGHMIAAAIREESGRSWLKFWRAVAPTTVDPGRGRPVAASPDARLTVNRYPDGSLHVYEGDTHRLALELPDTSITIRDIAIDNSARVVAITSVDRTVTGWFVERAGAWQWAAGQTKATQLPVQMDLDRKRAVRLSQDGTRAAAIAAPGGRSLIAVYDVNRKEALRVQPLLAEANPALSILSVGAVGGSSNLILLARQDGSFRVIPAGQWESNDIIDLHHPDSLVDAQFVLADRSAQGTQSEQRRGDARAQQTPLVLTASDDNVVLWDVRSGTKLREIKVGWSDAVSAAVSDDGQRIAIASSDEVHLFGPSGDESDKIDVGMVGTVRQMRLSRDGHLMVVAGRRGAALWKAPFTEPGRELSDEPAAGVALSPDGKLVALTGADRDVRIVRLEDFQTLRVIPFATDTRVGTSFTPDGQRLLTVQGQHALLINLQTGEAAGEAEMSLPIESAMAVMVGEQLQIIAGFADGTWQVREPVANLPQGREVVARSSPTIPLDETPPSLAVAADGRVAVAVPGHERIYLFDSPSVAATRPAEQNVARSITTTLGVAAIAFTHNDGGILHVENSSDDSQYVSLVDITDEFGNEVVTRKLSRGGINRIVGARNWIALDVDNDNEIKPAPTILRFPQTTIAENIRETGVMFDDDNFRWKPLSLAEHANVLTSATATRLDARAGDFWSAWWTSQAARDTLLLTNITLSRAHINEVYGPLFTSIRQQPQLSGHVPQEMLDRLQLLASTDPQRLSGKGLTDRLAAIQRMPLIERIVLLDELRTRVEDASIGTVEIALAAAYVERSESLTGYDALSRDTVVASALVQVKSAAARGDMPTPEQENSLKPLWDQSEFPLTWMPAKELSDRAWELMKPNEEETNRKALVLLDAACKKDTRSYNPWLHRSIVLGRLGEHAKAVENYKTMLAAQTIDDKEDLARVWANLGFRYGQWGRDHYADAHAAIAKALEVDPSYTTAYSYRVDLYREESKLDLAWEDAQKLPLDADGSYTRAQVLLALGRWELAQTNLQMMVDYEKDNPSRWIDRANALIDGKNRALLPAAVESATEAIRLEQARTEPNRNRLKSYYERRGVALRRMGLFDRALRDFESMLEIRPTDAFAIAETGAIATSQGRTEDALVKLRQSLEIFDQDGWTLDQLARTHMRRLPADLPAALEASSRAIRISGGWLPRRAEIYRRMGGDSLQAAENDLRESIRRTVDPLQSRVSLGLLLLERNRAADARAAFEEVLTYTPWVGDDDTRSRALALALLGRHDQAMTELGLTPGQQNVDADRYKVLAQVAILRAAGGPNTPLAADNSQSLVALHALILHIRWADVDYGDLEHDYLLRPLAQHPLFRELIAAIQKPLDDAARDLILARVATTVATRLRSIDALPPQYRVDCLRAAEQFQSQARSHGATDAQIQAIIREASTVN